MEPIYVYTDGACSRNGTPEARAGYGIYFGEDDPRNVYEQVQGRQTNNVAELQAIIKVHDILQAEIERGIPIYIGSDSNIAIGWCTTTGAKYEAKGWKPRVNIDLIRKAYTLSKKDNIHLFKIKAHTNDTSPHSIGNAGADRLAKHSIHLV